LFKAACLCRSRGNDGSSLCWERWSFLFLRGALLEIAFHLDSNILATMMYKNQTKMLQLANTETLNKSNIKG